MIFAPYKSFLFPGSLPSGSQRKKAEIPANPSNRIVNKMIVPTPKNIFSSRSLQSSSKQRKKRETSANPSKPPSQFYKVIFSTEKRHVFVRKLPSSGRFCKKRLIWRPPFGHRLS